MPSEKPILPATLSEQLRQLEPTTPAPSINITINISSSTFIFQQTPSPGGSKSDAPQL